MSAINKPTVLSYQPRKYFPLRAADHVTGPEDFPFRPPQRRAMSIGDVPTWWLPVAQTLDPSTFIDGFPVSLENGDQLWPKRGFPLTIAKVVRFLCPLNINGPTDTEIHGIWAQAIRIKEAIAGDGIYTLFYPGLDDAANHYLIDSNYNREASGNGPFSYCLPLDLNDNGVDVGFLGLAVFDFAITACFDTTFGFFGSLGAYGQHESALDDDDIALDVGMFRRAYPSFVRRGVHAIFAEVATSQAYAEDQDDEDQVEEDLALINYQRDKFAQACEQLRGYGVTHDEQQFGEFDVDQGFWGTGPSMVDDSYFLNRIREFFA